MTLTTHNQCLSLKALSPEDLKHPTVNIVGDDQAFIMGLLMYAIRQVDHDSTQKIMLFLSKFGQKEKKGLDLVTLVRRDGVKAITCHAACTLTSNDPRVDLLWSRYGLQEVVGHRGSI